MQMSESIANVATALSAFEAEVQNPHNTASNPFHKNKYAPLQDILRDVRPLLAQHGLAVTQPVHSEGNAIGVTTVLMHTSGEYIADTVTMEPGSEKGKSAAQLAGSVITYLRRYSLASVLGIASEDDDDGNAGLRNNNGHQEPTKPTKPAQQPDYSVYLSQSINNISPSKYPHALRGEIEWLRARGHDATADEFAEQARDLKQQGAAHSEYLQLLKDARASRQGADMDAAAEQTFDAIDEHRKSTEAKLPAENPEEELF